MKKRMLFAAVAVFALLARAGSAAAFTNNRYLAYGKKVQPSVASQAQVLGSSVISSDYIAGLVNQAVNKLVAEGLLKGQKGDKGDPGQPGGDVSGTETPDDYAIVPASVDYNSNIPGNMGGFTELSANDFTAQTSLTVDSGPVEIAQGANLNVDGSANFNSPVTMASTSMSDLNVNTIESSSGAYLSDGGDWVNASSRDLKTNLATISPQSILTQIDNLPIYIWNYKTQTAASTHMGPMAEDFYAAFGLGDSSSSISTIDPAGVALAGIQGLDAKVSSLMDLSWILDGLKNLGLQISQDLLQVKNFIADSITTSSLVVGSGSQPTGITIYDRATGQPVCIYSENNALQSAPGNCDAGLINSSAAAPVEAPQADSLSITAPPALSPDQTAVTSSPPAVLTPPAATTTQTVLPDENPDNSSTSTSTGSSPNN